MLCLPQQIPLLCYMHLIDAQYMHTSVIKIYFSLKRHEFRCLDYHCIFTTDSYHQIVLILIVITDDINQKILWRNLRRQHKCLLSQVTYWAPISNNELQ